MTFSLFGAPLTYPVVLLLGLGLFFVLNLVDIVLTYAVLERFGPDSQPTLQPYIERYGLIPTLVTAKLLMMPIVGLSVGVLDSRWDSGILMILLSWYIYHLLLLRENWLSEPRAVRMAFQRFFHPH